MDKQKYRIRRCCDLRAIESVRDSISEVALPVTRRAFYWLIEGDRGPVGFAGMTFNRRTRVATLVACGIKPEARGNGLQLRAIRVRERLARSMGATRVRSYTAAWNIYSANNLIAAGYRLIVPSGDRDGGRWLEFEKRLS